MEEHEAQAESHSTMVDTMNTEYKEVLKHKQASMGLEERIKYYEERYKQHQQEAEEKDRTVAILGKLWR